MSKGGEKSAFKRALRMFDSVSKTLSADHFFNLVFANFSSR